uniref:Uncharacterized protein n=1 Tax=Candidatus Kentrum sp. LPFa TaxID=2126335 RepID=A0A450W2D0_9GAMM|nr:MAG: hypothetical protein BECKLPF1236B_GA0070989_102028 [Candidatus Kentron sp. LPFa]
MRYAYPPYGPESGLLFHSNIPLIFFADSLALTWDFDIPFVENLPGNRFAKPRDNLTHS